MKQHFDLSATINSYSADTKMVMCNLPMHIEKVYNWLSTTYIQVCDVVTSALPESQHQRWSECIKVDESRRHPEDNIDAAQCN